MHGHDPPELSYSIAPSEDGSLVLRLAGELDMGGTEALRNGVADAVASVTGTLVLDLAQLRFADSSAIALWVGWSKQVPRIELRNPSPMVSRVIQAMGLTKILNPS